MKPFFVSHDGIPLEDAKPATPSPDVEQQTLDDFYKFCEQEARKASTPQEKHAEKL